MTVIRKNKWVVVSAFFTGVLWAATSAVSLAGTEPLKETDVSALIPEIEKYVEQSMRTWSAPGVAIAIVANDRIVYAKGFGQRLQGSAEPVDTDTVFQIGSTSKAFVSATEAIAVDQGLIDWDDRVIDHFSDFYLYDPWVTREFRIIDLLAQRSGLPAYALTDMALYGYDADDIISALRYIKPVSSFRNEFAYQNAFHLIAGKIVAQVSGEPDWGSFAQKYLLEPLGMHRTFTEIEPVLKLDNVARGHHPEDGRVVVDPFYEFPYNVLPAGGLSSSVNDMGQWLRLQINAGEVDGARIISSENLQQTWLPRVALSGGGLIAMLNPGNREARVPYMASYANGWVLHSGPEGRVIEHGGSTAGFNSLVAFDPDRKVGVVVLSNLCFDVGPGPAFGIGMHVMDLLQGRSPVDYSTRIWEMVNKGAQASLDATREPLPLPVAAYAGSYESPTLGRIDIEATAAGALTFTIGPKRIPVTLTHRANNLFDVAIYPPVNSALPAEQPDSPMRIGGSAFFNIGAEGKATELELNAMDSAGQLPFVRLP